jgi:thiol:disulfide interchange protein
VQKPKELFTHVKTMEELDEQLFQADLDEKAVMIYFYMDICPVCNRLKETTWKDANIQTLLNEKYIAIAVDIVDKSDEDIDKIKKRFNIFGPPGFVFF